MAMTGKTGTMLCVAVVAMLGVTLVACGTRPQAIPAEGMVPVPATGEWIYFADADSDGGSSSIEMTVTQEGGMPAFHFAGEITTMFRHGFAGFGLRPDRATVEFLKAAESVSFMVRGDGQRYSVQIVIPDATEHAYFWFLFDTVADEAIRVVVPIDDPALSGWTGQAEMLRGPTEGLRWQTHESWRPGTFELTVWDVTLYVREGAAAGIRANPMPEMEF
ncbi:MAG: CIA30 family protein [Treponema sp.]|nr:CIA30 family protein [Treponema sp.]